jgi:hypothetical protein
MSCIVLLEIEILIHLGRGDADLAAGREAPVGGGDLGARHGFAQARHFDAGTYSVSSASRPRISRNWRLRTIDSIAVWIR